MKTSFEECYSTTNETIESFKGSTKSTTKLVNNSNIWFTIGIIIGVTIAMIAVIIGVIFVVNRSNNKVEKQLPKANRNESSIESQCSSKQSDSLDEIARNLKPGQKFRVLRFKSEVLEKEMLS